MNTLGLYIHFPFCINKCPYCDFYSCTDRSSAERYCDALMHHIEEYKAPLYDYDIDTVFLGGGTPTSVPNYLLLDVLSALSDNFHLTRDAEITLEANPATVKSSELRRLRRAGVNRLSMGLQSADDGELQRLGRIHTFDDYIESFAAARKAGFTNINTDIMYGIPDQTVQSLTETLERVIELSPEHISLYGLKIEKGTPFDESRTTLNLPDEDSEAEMYFSAIELLRENGYAQYEISNFSKAGKQCLHNLKYWNCEEYLGFGPGAHSYFGGRRFAYKKSTEDYISHVTGKDVIPDILSEDYEIKDSERLGEYVMLRMRLTEGVDTAAFASKFGVSFEKMFEKYLPLYVDNGFISHSGRKYAFTPKGMYVSNYILSAMLDFDSEIISGIADGSDK